jgi:hypothetical protein
MQPNAIRPQMHRNEPIVMLQKKHHTQPSLLQIVCLQQMIDIFSVLLDLGFLVHRPLLTQLQAALAFSLVSNLA